MGKSPSKRLKRADEFLCTKRKNRSAREFSRRNHDGTPVIFTIYLAAHASELHAAVCKREQCLRGQSLTKLAGNKGIGGNPRAEISVVPPPIDALFPLPFSCAAGTMRAIERCASIEGMRKKGGGKRRNPFQEGSSSILDCVANLWLICNSFDKNCGKPQNFWQLFTKKR